MFFRSNASWSHMKMKSPEVSIGFAFCSFVSLWGTNREQIFRFPKSSGTMVCAVSLLMPNSSAMNLSADRRSCASICRTFSIISGVLLVHDLPEYDSLSRFLPFAKAFEPFVNTFSVHGFPPVHLQQYFTHLHYSFPQFVAELDVSTLLH